MDKSADYLRSHPWIRFELELDRAPYDLWIQLGEAVSRCDQLSGVALDPEAARELMRVYLAKGVVATVSIEGNTLTEREVRERIDKTLELPRSKEYLGVEVDNIVTATNEVLMQCHGGGWKELTVEAILGFNRETLRNLELEAHIEPGKLRSYSVGVADYRGAPAQDLPRLMDRLCTWINSPWFPPCDFLRPADLSRLEAILKAVMAHLYIAWIHPFGDGNGRTARLVEFAVLAAAGVPAPAAHLLSNHYNETRTRYYRELSIASKSGGDVIPFCKYAINGFVDQLRQQSDVVRQQQVSTFWRAHLQSTLGDSASGRRRRDLVLDLGESKHAVPKAKLSEVSVRVLRNYLGKSEKTLSRDIDELLRLRLIRKQEGGFVPNIEKVSAYLPHVLGSERGLYPPGFEPIERGRNEE